MRKWFVLFWAAAGLLTLDRTVGHRPAVTSADPGPASRDTLAVIEALRTRCQLPAGTIVFVVRDAEAAR